MAAGKPMRARMSLAAAIVVFAVVTAVMLPAQTTQSLSGTVFDADQGVVPGASVTIEGPALAKARSVTTNDKGRYKFPELPEGSGYAVTFRLVGLETAVERDVSIPSGAGVILDAVLSSK
jgi:hypothetical protein